MEVTRKHTIFASEMDKNLYIISGCNGAGLYLKLKSYVK